MNRRGFEHVDASHGLEFLCEVHVLPILSYRPSLYYLMSPFLSSLLILMLACVAFMCCSARLLIIFCRHRNPLGRSSFNWFFSSQSAGASSCKDTDERQQFGQEGLDKAKTADKRVEEA